MVNSGWKMFEYGTDGKLSEVRCVFDTLRVCILCQHGLYSTLNPTLLLEVRMEEFWIFTRSFFEGWWIVNDRFLDFA